MTLHTDLNFRPHLNPSSPPKFHSEINRCDCGAKQWTDESGIFQTSVVLIQDDEGWFRVICAKCYKEGISAASGETAIKLWNEGEFI